MSCSYLAIFNSKVLAVAVFNDPKISFNYNFIFLIFLLYVAICSRLGLCTTGPTKPLPLIFRN